MCGRARSCAALRMGLRIHAPKRAPTLPGVGGHAAWPQVGAPPGLHACTNTRRLHVCRHTAMCAPPCANPRILTRAAARGRTHRALSRNVVAISRDRYIQIAEPQAHVTRGWPDQGRRARARAHAKTASVGIRRAKGLGALRGVGNDEVHAAAGRVGRRGRLRKGGSVARSCSADLRPKARGLSSRRAARAVQMWRLVKKRPALANAALTCASNASRRFKAAQR